MKKKINAGVIGTGYGNYVILEALNKIRYINQTFIYGRNKLKIKKLSLNKKAQITYTSLKAFLKNDKISLICLATIPKKQYQILNKIKTNHYNYYFLEKPLADNFKNAKKIYKKFKNIKSRVAVDFMFLGLKSFLDFKKIIKVKKILKVNIKWHFNAHHYKKNISYSWKKQKKLGGGIYLFYIIHTVSYINFLFGRILKVYNKKEIKNNLDEICGVNLSLKCSNKININLDFNSNSSENIHRIEAFTKKTIFKLEKKSDDHVKNFQFFKLNNSKNVLKKITHNKKYLSKDTRVEPVINLLNNLLVKKKPISNILDAFKASSDLQKIIDVKFRTI